MVLCGDVIATPKFVPDGLAPPAKGLGTPLGGSVGLVVFPDIELVLPQKPFRRRIRPNKKDPGSQSSGLGLENFCTGSRDDLLPDNVRLAVYKLDPVRVMMSESSEIQIQNQRSPRLRSCAARETSPGSQIYRIRRFRRRCGDPMQT